MLDNSISDTASAFQKFWYLMPMGLVGLVSWMVWALRWTLSRGYQPTVNGHRATTSVVVPSYREDPDVLMRCLESWRREGPDEIILVVDLDDTTALARLAAIDDPRVCVIPFRHAGKRSALGVGIRASRQEIVILTDSDTCWEPGLLAAVQMPFVDPEVGGVSTRQNAYARGSSVWRRVADWLVNIRYLDFVPAQGRAGGVACLSGRTAAYRRSVIVPLVPDLENEIFLGRKCNAGDDGRLTWLVLGAGYKTVYQGSARAWSMFPGSFRAFVKQRLRWSRNSYRCYLTAMWRGWLWRQPLMTQITVMQILLTPVSMLCAVSVVAVASWHQHWDLAGLGVAGMLVGRGIRSVSHLREHPEDLPLLPLVTGMVVLIALPIKTWAALTMNTHDWLTRHSDRIAGEAQTEASLNGHTALPLGEPVHAASEPVMRSAAVDPVGPRRPR